VWIHFVVTLGCRTYQDFEIKQFWINPRAKVYKLISFESLNQSDVARYRIDLQFVACRLSLAAYIIFLRCANRFLPMC
jgi:hypothetical protein